MADILYYQWTSVDVFEFFGWDDQVVYKVGVEFRPSDKLALRAGFNYGESPIQGGNRLRISRWRYDADAAFANYLFPAISETHVTVGLGYKMDKNMTISGLLPLRSGSQPDRNERRILADAMPAGTEISMTQNAFGLGINYAAK